MTTQSQPTQTDKSTTLRVRDIFPPYNKDKRKGVIDWQQPVSENNQPKPIEAAGDIPKFDLGMEVLARQRQAASQKRQGPSQKPFQIKTPNIPSKTLNEEVPETFTIEKPAPVKPQVPAFLKDEMEQTPQPQITEEPKFDAELITKPVSHIADRLMPIMNQTEEQLIFDIVESDIKRFLQQ